MGPGRRMKKQGPPAPLDESKITLAKYGAAAGTTTTTTKKGKSNQKKRKVVETELSGKASLENGSGKKRRKKSFSDDLEHDDDDEEELPMMSGGVSVSASAPSKAKGTAKKGPPIAVNGKSNGAKPQTKPSQKKARQLELESEDEEEDDSESGSAVMDDEFGDLDGVSSGEEDLSAELDEDDDSVFDSDEENDRPRQTMFSDDEDESDAEEQLTAANIEGLSRKLDLEREAEEEEAEKELQENAIQTNIAGDQPDVFGEGEDAEKKSQVAPNMQFLRTRITDTIRILGDLATLGQPGKSRADYMQLFLEDICTYYGYTPFLAEKLMSLFTPMEAFAFFEANETPRPVVIRTNTLRTNRRTLAQALINRGVVLEPVGKWSKVGLQVFESAVPLGATPEYLAGHYILQAASSFLPVMALAPQPEERVLDMASAPGGKTTYISALMRNTGTIIANDASKVRTKGLIGNIHRLGCKNTIVSNLDAREAFPKLMGGFDRVLLDAPCTGTGVIAKDPSVKTSKTERDFLAIPHMQKQLLLAAIDSTDHHSKTGGYIVYSTCSVSVEENEQVVQYALRKRPNVKIVDTGLGSFGSEGFKSYMGKTFDAKMTLTRRYFPHRENVDGFFVCKLKKTGPSPNMSSKTNGTAAAVNGASKARSEDGLDASEVVDKTPIIDDENGENEQDTFGPFDDEADNEIIQRAERNRLRRKGVNPKAVKGSKPGKEGEDSKEGKEQSGKKGKKAKL